MAFSVSVDTTPGLTASPGSIWIDYNVMFDAPAVNSLPLVTDTTLSTGFISKVNGSLAHGSLASWGAAGYPNYDGLDVIINTATSTTNTDFRPGLSPRIIATLNGGSYHGPVVVQLLGDSFTNVTSTTLITVTPNPQMTLYNSTFPTNSLVLFSDNAVIDPATPLDTDLVRIHGTADFAANRTITISVLLLRNPVPVGSAPFPRGTALAMLKAALQRR